MNHNLRFYEHQKNPSFHHWRLLMGHFAHLKVRRVRVGVRGRADMPQRLDTRKCTASVSHGRHGRLGHGISSHQIFKLNYQDFSSAWGGGYGILRFLGASRSQGGVHYTSQLVQYNREPLQKTPGSVSDTPHIPFRAKREQRKTFQGL